MAVEFMLSGRSRPSESSTVAPTSGRVTKPSRRVVALRARPGSMPRPAMANVGEPPEVPRCSRTDHEHPVTAEVDPLEELAEQLVGFGAAAPPALRHARDQSAGGRCDRPAPGRTSRPTRHCCRSPRPRRRRRARPRCPPPPAWRGEVDHAELAPDGAAGHPARLVHHGQRGLAVALVRPERRAAIGVGDDRCREPGVADRLAHRPRRRAVQQPVGVGHRVADGQGEHGSVARDPRPSRRGTARRRCWVRPSRRHPPRRRHGRAAPWPGCRRRG